MTQRPKFAFGNQSWKITMVTEQHLLDLLGEHIEKEWQNLGIPTEIQLMEYKYDIWQSIGTEEGRSSNILWCVYILSGDKHKYQYWGMFQLMNKKIRVIDEKIIDYYSEDLVRDMVLMPYNELVYVFTNSKIEKLRVSKKEQSAYRLMEQGKLMDLPNYLEVGQAVVDVGGEYFVVTGKLNGMALIMRVDIEEQQMKILSSNQKYQLFSIGNTNQLSPNVFQTIQSAIQCIDAHFLTTDTIQFIPNTHRVATAKESHICIWDMASLKLQSLTSAKPWSQWHILNKQYPLNYTRDSLPLFTTLKYTSNFLSIVDIRHMAVHYYQYTPNNLQYSHSAMMMSEFDSTPMRSIKLTQIKPIDTIFYYQQYFDLGQFIKWDQLPYQLIKDLDQSILYVFYSHSHGLCFINKPGYQLICYQLLIDCGKTQLTSISQCISQCKHSQYWNAVKMQCFQCSQMGCVCPNPSQSVSMQTGQCELDCSKISKAIASSQYQNRCYCKSGWQWSQQSNGCNIEQCKEGQIIYNNQCILDCSLIPYSLQNNSPLSCECQQGFVFINGKCQFVCRDTRQYAQWLNGFPICTCVDQFIWNTQTLTCVKVLQANDDRKDRDRDQSQKDNSVNNVAVIITFIAIFLLLVFIAFCVVCCSRRNAKLKKQAQQANMGSEEKDDEIQSDQRLAASGKKRRRRNRKDKHNNSIQVQSLCHICGVGGVDCQGPCLHQFHYKCITSRIRHGDKDCAFCGCLFVNGLQDIKLIDIVQS